MRSLECWTSEPKRASLRAAVDLLGQRRALERERDLGRQRGQAALQRPAGSASRRRSRAARASRRAPRAAAGAWTPTSPGRRSSSSALADSGAASRTPAASEQRGRGRGRDRPRRAELAVGDDDAVALRQAEPGGHSSPASARAAASAARQMSARLVAATRSAPAALRIRSRATERSCWRTRPAMRATTRANRRIAATLTDEAVVALVDDLQQRHDRRDQRGAGEHHQPQRREARVALRRGPLELAPSTGAAPPRPTAGRS